LKAELQLQYRHKKGEPVVGITAVSTMGCEHSTPMVTVQDFQYVHPQSLNFLDDTIRPAKDPGQAYHLTMNEKIWSRRAQDAVNVQYAVGGEPFEANLRREGGLFSGTKKMILQNKNGETIAILLRNWTVLPSKFIIYAFKPLYQGQVPSNHRSDDGRPIFAWAKVLRPPFSMQYIMKASDGTVFVADRVGRVCGPKQFKLKRNGKTCASMQLDPGPNMFSKKVWDIKIAPGIDPSLILCFIAIIQAIIEARRRAAAAGAAGGGAAGAG